MAKQLEKKEKKRQEKIKKYGRIVKGLNGILGWKLGREELINYDYQFPVAYKNINTSNIDDVIRKLKRDNIKSILWNPILYEIIINFCVFCGLSPKLLKKEFVFMGVKHIKSLGIETYKGLI